MKRFISLLLCMMVMGVFPLITRAADSLPLVMDHGNILSAEEETLLEAEASVLQKEYGYDVVILTLESLGGNSIQNYADDFYDASGYSNDGVILVLSMNEREWYISTCGDVIYALTDYGISNLGDEMLPNLSSGKYYDAFDAYLQMLPEYFDAYLYGSPIDGYADYSGDYYHGTREEILYYADSYEPSILLSVVIGLVAAAIVILVMRSSMNSKRPQASAASYLKSGSYHLHTHQDLFLYSNVSKIRRQENNNSHGGGGSSVHRSTGGRRHGGGGGRF